MLRVIGKTDSNDDDSLIIHNPGNDSNSSCVVRRPVFWLPFPPLLLHHHSVDQNTKHNIEILTIKILVIIALIIQLTILTALRNNDSIPVIHNPGCHVLP